MMGDEPANTPLWWRSRLVTTALFSTGLVASFFLSDLVGRNWGDWAGYLLFPIPLVAALFSWVWLIGEQRQRELSASSEVLMMKIGPPLVFAMFVALAIRAILESSGNWVTR